MCKGGKEGRGGPGGGQMSGPGHCLPSPLSNIELVLVLSNHTLSVGETKIMRT